MDDQDRLDARMLAEQGRIDARAAADRAQALAIETFEKTRAEVRDRLGHSVAFARDAVRGLLIINGGAVIGLFTFLANLNGKDANSIHVVFPKVWAAFGFFGFGTGAAVLATTLGFLCQDQFFMVQDRQACNAGLPANVPDDERGDIETPRRWGERFRLAGIGIGLVGLVCFWIGSTLALLAFAVNPTSAMPRAPATSPASTQAAGPPASLTPPTLPKASSG